LISFSPDWTGGVCSQRMPDELPPRVIASIAFVGRSDGQVKALAGFNKRHHSLPDAANAVTNAFLGKICASELGDEAERLFQSLRSALAYKRKDIALSVTAPLATLTARDFTLERVYALDEREPARYSVTSTLRELSDADFLRREGVTQVFAGAFSEISLRQAHGRVSVRLPRLHDTCGGRRCRCSLHECDAGCDLSSRRRARGTDRCVRERARRVSNQPDVEWADWVGKRFGNAKAAGEKPLVNGSMWMER
jgi:hypothetical protein